MRRKAGQSRPRPRNLHKAPSPLLLSCSPPLSFRIVHRKDGSGGEMAVADSAAISQFRTAGVIPDVTGNAVRRRGERITSEPARRRSATGTNGQGRTRESKSWRADGCPARATEE